MLVQIDLDQLETRLKGAPFDSRYTQVGFDLISVQVCLLVNGKPPDVKDVTKHTAGIPETESFWQYLFCWSPVQIPRLRYRKKCSLNLRLP